MKDALVNRGKSQDEINIILQRARRLNDVIQTNKYLGTDYQLAQSYFAEYSELSRTWNSSTNNHVAIPL